ncbi:MAG: hypothetical protein HY316_04700 [Acidobacteria bacterium]|nr:hypothetical protein [Acidobacteriota bacterium]
MKAKTALAREALTFSRHVFLTWCFLGVAYVVSINPTGQVLEPFVFPLASWGGMVWLSLAAMAIARFGEHRFDMAVAAEAIYSLGIISLLVAASLGAVLILKDFADFSITALVKGLPHVKWLFAESVLGIGLSNGLSTLVRIFEVECGRGGTGRGRGGGTIAGGDMDLSKIASDVHALGEVLAQVHAKARALHETFDSVNTSAAPCASQFSHAQEQLAQLTSTAKAMTGEMRATVTLWKNIATLLASFDGFRVRKA